MVFGVAFFGDGDVGWRVVWKTRKDRIPDSVFVMK